MLEIYPARVCPIASTDSNSCYLGKQQDCFLNDDKLSILWRSSEMYRNRLKWASNTRVQAESRGEKLEGLPCVTGDLVTSGSRARGRLEATHWLALWGPSVAAYFWGQWVWRLFTLVTQTLDSVFWSKYPSGHLLNCLPAPTGCLRDNTQTWLLCVSYILRKKETHTA